MKITVGLFFGGRSTEHEVSIITGLQAYNAFDKAKYDVVPIYITKETEFFTGEYIGKIEEYSDISALLKKSVKTVIIKDGGRVKLYGFNGKKISKKPLCELDVALPAVHGTNVEDGVFQGFLQTLGVPYAGCDVLSSSVGMDKYVMKAVLKEAGVSVLDCAVVTSRRYIAEKEVVAEEVSGKIGFPAIVKPINLGSSIGIAKADNLNEFNDALEHAFLFANRVIVEPMVVNLKEVNCAVLGDADYAQASECEEPLAAGRILGFDDKYSGGGKGGKGGGKSKSSGMASLKRKIPADISPCQREKIRSTAVTAFQALGCSGVARIDFLIDMDSEQILFNEINTIPGSLSFYLWEPVGIGYPELLDKMLMLALKRERDLNALSFTFENNILSNFNRAGASLLPAKLGGGSKTTDNLNGFTGGESGTE